MGCPPWAAPWWLWALLVVGAGRATDAPTYATPAPTYATPLPTAAPIYATPAPTYSTPAPSVPPTYATAAPSAPPTYGTPAPSRAPSLAGSAPPTPPGTAAPTLTRPPATAAPTATPLPSVTPSLAPTPLPSLSPSPLPSPEPSPLPEPAPTHPPTTSSPTVTPQPSVVPSLAPTSLPTIFPSPAPSTPAPTVSPSTKAPSDPPTQLPTPFPSLLPSSMPTAYPGNPTRTPFAAPTTAAPSTLAPTREKTDLLVTASLYFDDAPGSGDDFLGWMADAVLASSPTLAGSAALGARLSTVKRSSTPGRRLTWDAPSSDARALPRRLSGAACADDAVAPNASLAYVVGLDYQLSNASGASYETKVSADLAAADGDGSLSANFNAASNGSCVLNVSAVAATAVAVLPPTASPTTAEPSLVPSPAPSTSPRPSGAPTTAAPSAKPSPAPTINATAAAGAADDDDDAIFGVPRLHVAGAVALLVLVLACCLGRRCRGKRCRRRKVSAAERAKDKYAPVDMGLGPSKIRKSRLEVKVDAGVSTKVNVDKGKRGRVARGLRGMFFGYKDGVRPTTPVDDEIAFRNLPSGAQTLLGGPEAPGGKGGGAAAGRRRRSTAGRRGSSAKRESAVSAPTGAAQALSVAGMASELSAKTTFLAHYLPWFQYDLEKSEVGYHWTLNANGFRFEGDGRVAGHCTPMIGPYDSRDRRVVRYHLQLMKDAGVRGVIVRWFGTQAGYYYEHNLRAADVVCEECDAANMLFTIIFEDRAPGSLIARSMLETRDEAVTAQLTKDFEYLRDRYMGRNCFLRHGRKKEALILLLGPSSVTSALPWASAIRKTFADPGQRPRLVTMMGSQVAESAEIEVSFYSWFPKVMQPYCTLRGVGDYLDDFYEDPDCLIGSAFPEYHDYYVEGGDGASKGRIAPHDGMTLDNCVEAARRSEGLPYVQLLSWNNYAEGTCLEPTREHDFTHLCNLQTRIVGRPEKEAKDLFQSRYLEITHLLRTTKHEIPDLADCPAPSIVALPEAVREVDETRRERARRPDEPPAEDDRSRRSSSPRLNFVPARDTMDTGDDDYDVFEEDPPGESEVSLRAAQESEIPNFKGSSLGRFPLVSADFWTRDHLSERSRSMNAFSGTRARGTLTLKRR